MRLLKKYGFYLFRWQLSTPILTVVLILTNPLGALWGTVIANFIGGLIFFWVDKIIFKDKRKNPIWEINENTVCVDCGYRGEGRRIIEWGKYDRTRDPNPKYRCNNCATKKHNEVKEYLYGKTDVR